MHHEIMHYEVMHYENVNCAFILREKDVLIFIMLKNWQNQLHGGVVIFAHESGFSKLLNVSEVL